MIRFLTPEEKLNTKALYREAFPQDSRSFVEYYYREKTKTNRVAGDIGADGRVSSMLMLNPYRVKVGQGVYDLDYIVAVATAENARRQGKMRGVLEFALREMEKNHVPFTYLLPANKDYYLPFHFAFVSNKEEWKSADLGRLLGPEALAGLRERVLDHDSPQGLFLAAADFVNQVLGETKDVYALRDEAYYRREVLELASEGGKLRLFFDREDRMQALFSVWGQGEVKECILSRELLFLLEHGPGKQLVKPAPGIMIRITDLRELVKNLALKETEKNDKCVFYLRLTDPLLVSQNGLFCWEAARSGSRLIPVQELPKGEEAVETDVGELTGWIFGYTHAEKFASLEKVEGFRGVFFDEAV